MRVKQRADTIGTAHARYMETLEKIANMPSSDCARDPFLCKALARKALRLKRATDYGTESQSK